MVWCAQFLYRLIAFVNVLAHVGCQNFFESGVGYDRNSSWQIIPFTDCRRKKKMVVVVGSAGKATNGLVVVESGCGTSLDRLQQLRAGTLYSYLTVDDLMQHCGSSYSSSFLEWNLEWNPFKLVQYVRPLQ